MPCPDGPRGEARRRTRELAEQLFDRREPVRFATPFPERDNAIP